MRDGGSVVGGSSYREAGVIPVKATRPSAAQVANPGGGSSSGLIGGVDIYQGVVGDVGGRWYGGRWHDDGNVVGDSGPRETAKRGDLHCSMLSSLSTLPVLPYPVPAATGRNGNTCGSGKTPTTAPKPPHTTRSNPWCEGPGPGARCAGHREAPSDTTLVGVPGGWRRWWEPVRRTGMAGNHPTDTYTLARRV